MANTALVLIVATHKQYAASLLKFNFNFTVLTFGMLLKCCTKSTGWFFKAQPSEKKRRRLQKPGRRRMYPYKTVQKQIYQRHLQTRWRFGYKKTIIFQWCSAGTCIFHIVRLMHESAAMVADSSANRGCGRPPCHKVLSRKHWSPLNTTKWLSPWQITDTDFCVMQRSLGVLNTDNVCAVMEQRCNRVTEYKYRHKNSCCMWSISNALCDQYWN